MHPSKRLTLACLAAVGLSGGCTCLLGRSLAHRSAAQQEHTLIYVTPRKPLPAGAVLSAGDLRTQSWPAGAPVEGALTSPAQAAGRATLYSLAPGEPLRADELSAPGSGAGLAGRIPPGMRAIALQSDEVIGVAGFLSPGSRVDMLVTLHTQNSPEPETRSVLQDVVVAATGQRTDPDPQGRPVTATVVTLLLTPEQAEQALLASTLGPVHFVLRNGADHGRDPVPPASSAFLGAAEQQPPASRAPATAPPLRHAATTGSAPQVEIVLGGAEQAAERGNQ